MEMSVRRGPPKKQMGVALDDELRAMLEASAAVKGHSLAAEIRQRLEQTFVDEGIDPKTRELFAKIVELDRLLWASQTNKLSWYRHAGAHRVFRNAIVALLARLRPPGEAVFAPGDLAPHPLIASEDPETIGLGLEAVVSLRAVPSRRELHPLSDVFEEYDRQQRDKGSKS
jgi:plasmid stability protein